MNEDRCGNCIELEIIDSDAIELEITGNCDDIPEYAGPYTVIPKRTAQELATSGRMMKDDVTVREIPYAEMPNVHGTTVTIAS